MVKQSENLGAESSCTDSMGHLVSHPRTHIALGTPSSSSLFQPQAGRVGVLCEHHLTSGFQVAQSSNGFPWLLGFRADLQILAETFLPVLQTLGKDRIIFVTKEDHETPSNAELVADDPNDPYEEHGEWLQGGCHVPGHRPISRCPLGHSHLRGQ